MLVVQGGPGTGKTVVALHRAAYLLYTHRFPLEDQGVLVIGPNRVFLRYIERVLPSLGEAGIEQVVLADLVPGVTFLRPGDDGDDSPTAARLKGEERMSDLIDNAVADRERPLREDVVVAVRCGLRPTPGGGVGADRQAGAAPVPAPQRRAQVCRERGLVGDGGDRGATPRSDPVEIRDAFRGTDEVARILDWMWPVLTPAQLLHDLFGSKALLRLAARDVMSESEALRCTGPAPNRSTTFVGRRPTSHSSTTPSTCSARSRGKGGKIDESDEIRTFGHIVIDEVQDLTPMQLKMATRRSLNGSMTIVGDIAQATGPLAPDGWDDVLAHLPDRKPPRVIGLSVGYRIPGQIMELANR